jgi:hypothetical protein
MYCQFDGLHSLKDHGGAILGMLAMEIPHLKITHVVAVDEFVLVDPADNAPDHVALSDLCAKPNPGRRGIPVVYYVAPQFWAWRQARVRLARDYVDKALVIFAFEEKFYREPGVDATFVGHPLADLPQPVIKRKD